MSFSLVYTDCSEGKKYKLLLKNVLYIYNLLNYLFIFKGLNWDFQ